MDLNESRKNLDYIDDEILKLFIKRLNVVKGIAEYKKENNLPILQQDRENEVLQRIENKAGEELAPYAKELFSEIMKISRDLQKDTLNK